MKKIMITGLIIVLGLFVAYAGNQSYKGFVKFKNLQNEAIAFVDGVVPKITSTWQSEMFVDFADRDVLGDAEASDILSMFTFYSKLGSLVKYHGSYGTVTTGWNSAERHYTKGVFVAKATYEQGEAEILLHITKHNGPWAISGISINADTLGEGKTNLGRRD